MRGHIRKRSKNSWSVVVDLGRDPATGKRRQKWYTVHGTKRDAQKFLTDLLHRINMGNYVEPNNMTFGEFLEQWLENYAKTNVESSTFEGYEIVIKKHIIPALGKVQLSKLQPLHLQSYYTYALKEGRKDGRGKGLSAKTVLQHHRIIHKALKTAVKWQVVARNVAEAVEPPKPEQYKANVLKVEEIMILLKEARESQYYMPILIAVATGMRRGEILGLRWKDIDMEKRIAHIQQTIVKGARGIIIKGPKTKKGRRSVLLPSFLLHALKQHKKKQEEEKSLLGSAYEDNDLICARADGKPLSPREVSRYFTNLVKKLGLTPVRFHDLRHTHATLLLKEGVHPKVVQDRLGHSDIGITMDTYSHVMPEIQKEAARTIENLLAADE